MPGAMIEFKRFIGFIFGSLAVMVFLDVRPIALRPRLSPGLPLSVTSHILLGFLDRKFTKLQVMHFP
jgi:hypothetical protein